MVGQRKRAAIERLRDAGFHVTVSRAEKHKPGVRVGLVVAQEPERGLRMCRRADIWLVASV
jgi:beta-lactam-binding protein with PASTA domain